MCLQEFPFSHSLIIIAIYSFFVSFTLFIVFFDINFQREITKDDLPTLFITFGFCLLILLICKILKWKILPLIHKKWELDEVVRCKLDLLIGFGGIIASCSIPKIVMLNVEWDRYTSFPIFTIPYFCLALFPLQFHHGRGRVIQSLDNELAPTLYSYLAQFILLIPTVRYSMPVGEEQKTPTILLQCVFSLILAGSCADFWAVLGGNFELRNFESLAAMDAREEPSVSEETHEDTFNDIVLYSYSFFAALVGICSISFLFIVDWTPEFQDTLTIVIAWFGMIGHVFGCIKLLVLHTFRSNNTGVLQRNRINLFIGFGGCVLSSLVARVLVYFVGFDYKNLYISQIIPLITAISFYYLFICGFRKTCNLDYANNWKLILKVVWYNFLMFLISIRIGICYEDQVYREIILASQCSYFMLLTVSMVDFGVVWKDGVYMNGKEYDPVRNKKVEKKVALKKRLECKICKSDYSEAKIPRILRECGHTVCEECLNINLETNKYIICPTCRVVTVVKGPASTLAKNYTILDAVH